MSDNPKVRAKGIKKFSVIFGSFAEITLLLTWLNILTSVTAAGILIIGFSVIHFYAMEVNQQLEL